MPTPLRHPRSVTLLGLVFGLALASGCQPACTQLCVESARYVEGCLEHWESVWPEFGYDDANAYIATCQTRVRTTIQLQDVQNQRTIRLQCAQTLGELTTSVGCNDYQPNDFELDPNGDDNNGVLPQPQGDGGGGGTP